MNISNLVRVNIRLLKPYSSARDEFTGKTGIFLDANENPYGELNRYPDPQQRKLKARLSELKNVSAENIFIGNGSDEIIDLIFRVFCTPGQDKALTFSPTYGMYEVSAGINDVELIKIPLTDNFQIEVQAASPYLNNKQIKVIFICSPNNPTGNIIPEKDIDFILNNFNGIVFIDEAYIDFANSPSWSQKINDYPNLIVSQTFSKAWGLAAARVGIAYANADILQYLNRIKPPYNVSQLNQQAALAALADTTKFEERKNIILKEKEKLQQALLNVDFVQKIYPSDANFLLVEVEDALLIYNELVKQQIIVRNRNKLVSNCIRITIGTPEENQKLIDGLVNLRAAPREGSLLNLKSSGNGKV